MGRVPWVGAWRRGLFGGPRQPAWKPRGSRWGVSRDFATGLAKCADMAEIVPFRGILYRPENRNRPDLSDLLAPPYDVISDAQRQALAARSPFNAVHLILPKDKSGGDSDERYGEAANALHRWLGASILQRDEQPALYRYHQIFKPPGMQDAPEVVRRGFIARIRLHRFAEGVVLPHERTLAGPKLDRLKLKRATRTHLSQVFGLYDDKERHADDAFAKVESQPPALYGTTEDGVSHRLWRLQDASAIAAIAALLRDKRIYIADGHHRYETMLALREELRQDPSYCGLDSSVEYGSIFLCNASDPGLLIFPTHRVLAGLPGFALPELLARLEEKFEIDEQGVQDAAAVQAMLQSKGERGPSFLLCSGSRRIYLTLRPAAAAAASGPMVLRSLDVTVLHSLVFEEALGIDRAAQEAQTYLRYIKDTPQALSAALDPAVQAVFVLNPTRVEQVMAVAEAGEVMPQKSTYFYPKIASGLVLNPFDPEERVDFISAPTASCKTS